MNNPYEVLEHLANAKWKNSSKNLVARYYHLNQEKYSQLYANYSTATQLKV